VVASVVAPPLESDLHHDLGCLRNQIPATDEAKIIAWNAVLPHETHLSFAFFHADGNQSNDEVRHSWCDFVVLLS
jgi:hypothetical protein